MNAGTIYSDFRTRHSFPPKTSRIMRESSVARARRHLRYSDLLTAQSAESVGRSFTNARPMYNRHKRIHAQKFQAVVLPNGIIGHLFGPYEGRHHDRHLLNESGLLDACLEHAIQPGSEEGDDPQDRYFQLFGDPAYGVSRVIMSPFADNDRTPEELEWNNAMSKAHIEVEHIFGIICRTWPFLNAYWKMQAYSLPVGYYYRTAALLTNVLTCFRGNQISTVFNCPPPSIDEYFILFYFYFVCTQ